MLEYLTGMMDVCYDLGGEVMVFGSPRNRMIGALSPEKARGIATGFFQEIGVRAAERDIHFLIEPLGTTETDFINTVSDAWNFIGEAGNPEGLGLHIDTKGIIDEKEVEAPYMKEMFARAHHVHISEPGLKPVGSSGFDHRIISSIIRQSGYSRFVSIEMRRVEDDVEKSLENSIRYVKTAYFGGKE
jgi:sugar phosphate isomerase/epimerase